MKPKAWATRETKYIKNAFCILAEGGKGRAACDALFTEMY